MVSLDDFYIYDIMLQVARMAITYIKHFRIRASMSGIILKTVRSYIS